MRNEASVLHLDLDAFYAAVEQRDKPSLRGKPVVVGGIGPRGVVATASYEARRYGVRSAMPTVEARSRCPHAAFLSGRFDAYRATSDCVMAVLREVSPLVEPLSLDEAYVDLAAGGHDLSPSGVTAVGSRLRTEVHEATGGLTASVGVGTSKLIAKIASEMGKPDGLVVVPPGRERELLRPQQVSALPGVGPATMQRLRRLGVYTVADLESVSLEELVRELGAASGATVFAYARGNDDRPVVASREAKSISAEDTFERDVVDPVLLTSVVERHARNVCRRLADARLSGRTVTLKVRLYDFSTITRSASLPGPTDRPEIVSRAACRLLSDVDTSGGVRLLGVGVSGLADWVQADLFDDLSLPSDELRDDRDPSSDRRSAADTGIRLGGSHWRPGMDIEHQQHGRGWVWGAGMGRITVRFETAATAPGPVRTFAIDDPQLRAVDPERLFGPPAAELGAYRVEPDD